MKNLIYLTKELISTQSYKDGEKYERETAEFLENFIQKNFPWMKTERQYLRSKNGELQKNRFNIFARDAYPTKLLVINHIDTVEPSSEWEKDPLKPFEKDGKIYGLGSSDTKGNIASFLTALIKSGETKGLAILWYVDEEYDFEGMKEFLKSNSAKSMQPETILSLDGQIGIFGIGCKGLIEVSLELKGKTGHSARPKSGVNVLRNFFEISQNLELWVNKFENQLLGKSTLNIAYLNGGFLKKKTTEKAILGKEGNRIPDYLETIIEIRTTEKDLNAKNLKEKIYRLAKEKNLKIENFKVRHDLISWSEDSRNFEKEIEVAKTEIPELNIDFTNGYVDVAMLKNLYPDAKIFVLGGAAPGEAHKPNEYVEIKNLEKAQKVYEKFLEKIVK